MDRLAVRAGAALSGLLALLAAGPAPSALWRTAWSPAPGADPTEAVVAAAAVIGELLAGFLVTAIALLLTARVPGAIGRSAGRLAGWVLPAVLRRALEVVLGAGLTAAAVGSAPALAAAPPAPPPAASAPVAAPDLDWPSPATGRAAASPAQPTAAAAAVPTALPGAQPSDGHVVVRPGDTLWGLAEGQLRARDGATPDAARIAASWPAWWAANREVVGDDPDLILPGTALHPPSSAH